MLLEGKLNLYARREGRRKKSDDLVNEAGGRERADMAEAAAYSFDKLSVRKLKSIAGTKGVLAGVRLFPGSGGCPNVPNPERRRPPPLPPRR